MNRELINIANIKGTLNGNSVNINSNETITELPDVYSINMYADREIWSDGLLTYTVIIRNITNIPLNPIAFFMVIPDISNVTINLNTTIVALDESTITVDDHSINPDDYIYNEDTGSLSIRFPTLKPGAELKVIFKVNKKSNNWSTLDEFAYFTCDPVALNSNVVTVRNVFRRAHQSGRCYDPYWRRP